MCAEFTSFTQGADAPRSRKMKSYQSRGFTLIELVVVITILGILAAFAIPRFIALDTQARTATVNALAGTVRSGAALARSLSMASGNPASVTMEGQAVAMLNNYPDSPAGGIANALNVSNDFTYAPGASGAVGTWTRVGAPAPATCTVTYLPATAAGAAPVVQATTGGC
jgi:MSHA pilin protein MshA